VVGDMDVILSEWLTFKADRFVPPFYNSASAKNSFDRECHAQPRSRWECLQWHVLVQYGECTICNDGSERCVTAFVVLGAGLPRRPTDTGNGDR